MKIAVIALNPHSYFGGIENYVRICYQDWLTKGYDITEFPTLKHNKFKDSGHNLNPDIKMDYSLLGWKPYMFVWGGTYSRKNFKKIYDNFDVVIINNPLPPRSWIKHPKSILVQHMDPKFYSLGGKPWFWSIGQAIVTTFFNAGTYGNTFKKASNIVFFAPETSAKSTGQVSYIPLTAKSIHEIEHSTTARKDFVWIGRLENSQKNVKAIIKLANRNDDITIYGNGPNLKMVQTKLKNKHQYQGFVNKNKVEELLNSTRALLLTSNFEGFSYITIEALSNGSPVIMFDTFKAAKFFEKSGAVFLIPAGNIEAFNAKIAWLRNLPIKDLEKLSKKAIDFAKKYLTNETFWRKWNQLIQKVTK